MCLSYCLKCNILLFQFKTKIFIETFFSKFKDQFTLNMPESKDATKLTKSVMPATVRRPKAKLKSCSRIKYPRTGDIAILETQRRLGMVQMFSLCKQ